MQHDEIIDCPRSGGDLCYKTEVSPEVTNYYSLSCGFHTNTLMLEGSEFYEEQVSVLPEIYKDLAWVDPETKLIWLPNIVNVKENGMVFASGADIENWSWGAVKAIEIPKEEQEKYKGEKYRADMTTIKYFKERDFMDALSYIGLLPE